MVTLSSINLNSRRVLVDSWMKMGFAALFLIFGIAHGLTMPCKKDETHQEAGKAPKAASAPVENKSEFRKRCKHCCPSTCWGVAAVFCAMCLVGQALVTGIYDLIYLYRAPGTTGNNIKVLADFIDA